MYEFKVLKIVVSLNALQLTMVLCPDLKYIYSHFEAIESKGTCSFSGLDSGTNTWTGHFLSFNFKKYFRP